MIGTGASSIQVVAALAPVCGHLSVFQRTPAWVLPKYNFTFPNWATLVMRYVPGQRWLFRQLLFWQREIHMAPAFFKPGGVESRLLTLAGAHTLMMANVYTRDSMEALGNVVPRRTVGVIARSCLIVPSVCCLCVVVQPSGTSARWSRTASCARHSPPTTRSDARGYVHLMSSASCALVRCLDAASCVPPMVGGHLCLTA